MAEKNMKARIVHKHDIESNWLLATNFTPKQGEIVVYDIDDNYSYERFKIGDGVQNVNDLPFAVMQSDWSENDETSPAYVKNRTHYEFEQKVLTEITTHSQASALIDAYNAGTAVAVINGVEYTDFTYSANTYARVLTTADSAYTIEVAYSSSKFYVTPSDIPWYIYEIETAVYPIDLKYLPDTVSTKDYVDTAIAAIPTPDVSGQIETHNTSETAHSDIRTSIGNLSTLVGDTAVSEQIEAAQIVYVGPTAPTDPNIKVWINTAEDGTGVVPVLPIITSVDLPANGWAGSNPYSQTVDVPRASSTSMITLQPSATQILALQDSEISMTVENDGNGVITFYAIGAIPSSDMTMQILITPVSYV